MVGPEWRVLSLFSIGKRTSYEPKAEGLLTEKYISGKPATGRTNDGGTFLKTFLSEENLKNVAGLDAIAKRRGQTLAQMAIAWVLRDPRVTSALIGARIVGQLDDSLDALKNPRLRSGMLGPF